MKRENNVPISGFKITEAIFWKRTERKVNNFWQNVLVLWLRLTRVVAN